MRKNIYTYIYIIRYIYSKCKCNQSREGNDHWQCMRNDKKEKEGTITATNERHGGPRTKQDVFNESNLLSEKNN